jgi:hypothetical protein
MQNFSSIYIDARRNWLGKNPPDQNTIWGESINIKHWLAKKENKAFREK